jgi:hypothetical protein
MFFQCLPCLVCSKVYACFNENHAKKAIKFLFRLSFALIGGFSSYILSRFSEQFSGSRAAFGNHFINTSGYRKAGTSSMKRVLKGFLQLVSDFIEASRNYTFDFLHKKTAKNY